MSGGHGPVLRRAGPELGVLAAGLVVLAWQVRTPSASRDEATTLAVAGRPLAGILALAGHVDRVHLAYYLIAHGTLLAGRGRLPDQVTPLTELRLLSVLAMAVAAAVTVRIGRILGSAGIGGLAGLLVVLEPLASRYAQEARSYALVTMAAALATWALAAGCRDGGRRLLPWAGYVLAAVAAAVLNAIGALVLVVHGAYVLLADRGAVRRWAAAAGVAVLLLVPWGAAVAAQRGQVAYLARPDPRTLARFLHLQLPLLTSPLLLVPAAAVLLARLLARVPLRRRAAGPACPRIAVLGLCWGLLPPLLLLAVSQLRPLWNDRYLLFSVPGTALAVAALVWPPPGSRRWAVPLVPAALVLAFAVSALPLQRHYRQAATGHDSDLKGMAGYLVRDARPGDAVLFVPTAARATAAAYPAAFAHLDDVMLGGSGPATATLAGVDLPPDRLAARLAGHDRVWLLTYPEPFALRSAAYREDVRVLGSGYRPVLGARLQEAVVTLYARNPGAPGP